MFHRFNTFTGRLVQTEKINSKFPLTPKSLNRADPPPIVYGDSRTKLQTVEPLQIKPASQQRSIHSKAGIAYGEIPENIKKAQELFQRPDGLPVHLKGSPAQCNLNK